MMTNPLGLGSVVVRDLAAVLFDMDGTLVDSDAVVERVWRAFCQTYGIDINVLLPVAQGVPAEDTIRRFRPDMPESDVIALAAEQLAVETADLAGIVATPGALDLLAYLDNTGTPWAVVTSADTRLATARLIAAGIPVPDVLITTDDIARGKPDPEGYAVALDWLGVDPAHALVVEDSAAGIAAGQAAGVPVAALKGLHGDLDIANLTDLHRLMLGHGGG